MPAPMRPKPRERPRKDGKEPNDSTQKIADDTEVVQKLMGGNIEFIRENACTYRIGGTIMSKGGGIIGGIGSQWRRP